MRAIDRTVVVAGDDVVVVGVDFAVACSIHLTNHRFAHFVQDAADAVAAKKN